MDAELLIVYLLVGTLGGLLSGLLGVGGGIIFIPLFDFMFRSAGIEGEELVRFILANSFLTIVFAGISSSLKHRKMGNFHWKEVITIALPATITGSLLSQWIATSSWYREIYFKWVFIVVILFTLWRTWANRAKSEDVSKGTFHRAKYALIGLLTGMISAISGLGGGIAMIPLLTMFGKLDIKKASAISISVIPIMVLPFLVIYANGNPQHVFDWSLGYLQFQFILPVILGVMIGSPLGVRWAQKMESKKLQLIFAALLLVIVSKYLYEVLMHHIL